MRDLLLLFAIGPVMAWPATLSVMLLGVVAFFVGPDQERRFRAAALYAFLTAPVLGLASMLQELAAFPGDAAYDVAAWVATSALVIGASAIAGIVGYRRGWTRRARCATVLAVGTVAVVVPAPLLMLSLHCLSGDCL